MLDTELGKFIVLTAVGLWFAQGWYFNTLIEKLHGRFDQIDEMFDGLREYLYENDPQFDDERNLLDLVLMSEKDKANFFSGMDHMELIKQKKSKGKRTLNSPFGR